MSVAQTAAPSGGTPAPAGAVNGGWYNGEQDENGVLGAPGVITNPDEQGYGSPVSAATVAQTNPNNVAYLAGQGDTFQSFGTTGASGGALPSPTGIFAGTEPAIPNLATIYGNAYTNNPDVTAAQASITNIQSQITQQQQDVDSATSDINDNPFFSEATRTGQIEKLNTNAQNSINTLTDQLNTAQGNLAQYQAQAQISVNLAQGQYSMENQQWQQNISEFNTLLSAGALENSTPTQLAGYSVSTGIPTDMLQSIATSEQAKNTQIVTSTNDAGDVTIAAVNSETGAVINTTTLAGAGAAKVGAAGTTAQAVATSYQSLASDISAGTDLQDLISYYTSVPASEGGLTAAQVLQAYNTSSNNPNGPAQETLKQVEAGQFVTNGLDASTGQFNYTPPTPSGGNGSIPNPGGIPFG